MAIARGDIEAVFGVENVAAWANLDGGDAGEEGTRVTDAITYAEAFVDDRFRTSRYAVPLVGNSATALDVVNDSKARLAGAWLHKTRGLRESEEVAEKMKVHEDDAAKTIMGYLAGTRLLDAARKDTTTTAPAVV